MIVVEDPTESKDYTFDWTLDLAPGETIATSVMDLDTGVSVTSNSHDTITTNVWGVTVSAAVLYQTYRIQNRIVTNQGRALSQSIYLFIAGR